MRPPGNGTAASEAGGARHDSIADVRARLALVLGGAAVAGAAAYRRVRRRPAPPATVAGEHADELRAKLAESRVVVDDREEFESAETPVDLAEDVVAPELGDRRKAVHERGRHVAEEMRRGAAD
jgi:hypothetical protein